MNSSSQTLSSFSLFLSRFSSHSPNSIHPSSIPSSFTLLSSNSPLPPFPQNFPTHKRIPTTRFVVDGFRHSGAFSVSYFLTHFHSDHYTGLSPNWRRGIIFCSPITARLVISCLKVPQEFVFPIEPNSPISIDDCEIVLIDANHCPGAVQILIRTGNEERYVHTGDMRFCNSMLDDEFLKRFVGADAVYLDNTYCNPRFVFPLQDESIEYVVKTIQGIREKGEKVLFLISTYVIGKERILLAVWRKLGIKVYVDKRKLEILDVLGLNESGEFTNDLVESDVHVIGWKDLGETWPYFRPNFVNMKKIMEEKGYSKAVGFVPTGWVFSAKRDGFVVRRKEDCEIHLVPYSEHSSYDELKEYVRFLRPKRVLPTVGVGEGKKGDTAYTKDIRKHFIGLIDERANKLKFLKAFHAQSLSCQSDSDTLMKRGMDGNDGDLGSSVNLENQKLTGESDEARVDTCLKDDNDHSLPESNKHDEFKVTGNKLMGSSEGLDEDLNPPNDDESMDEGIEELRRSLPDWMTVQQMESLFDEANGDIMEAMSMFYEHERELHEEIVLRARISSSHEAGTSSSIACDDRSISSLDFSCKDVSRKPLKEVGGSPKEVFEKILKSPQSKIISKNSKKRDRNVSSKAKKRAKLSSVLASSGDSKQVSITKFFQKPEASANKISESVFAGDEPSKSESEGTSTLLDNTGPNDEKVTQLLQILESGISRQSAVELLEKSKGDIHLALDHFYNPIHCKDENFQARDGLGVCIEKTEKAYEEKIDKNTGLIVTGGTPLDPTPGFVSLPPEKYNPVEHACWNAGQPAPYLHLARTFEMVEQERGKIKVVSMLCNMFRSLLALSPQDILPAVYLCTNRIAPDYENTELNIGFGLVSMAIEDACGTKKSRIREMYNNIGDLGDVAQACRQTQSLLVVPKPLSIREVFSVLKQISTEAGSGSTARKKHLVLNLMRSCREMEMKFLVRTLVRNMRIGAMMRTVLPALAQAVVMNLVPDFSRGGKLDSLKPRLQSISSAVVEAYSVLPNLDLLVSSLMSKGLDFSQSTISMVPGVPIKPMLAKITNGVLQATKRFQGKAFSCEYKYDGQRAQIHKLLDGSVRVFSCNGEESTSRFPDVVQFIKEVSSPMAETFIVDAEVVASDRKNNNNRLMAFQHLSSRERGGKESAVQLENIKVDVCVFVFDVMFANGERTLGLSLRERRKYLKKLFREAKVGCFEFAEEITVEADEANVESQLTLGKMNSFMENAFSASCEGIMVKTLDIDAEYAASKRADSWLKVKRDYIDGLGDSLDLIPIGAWHGNGRKAGWFSPFLMACYNSESEEFQSVCRVMSGFSDSFYMEMKEFFSADRTLPKKPPYYHTLEEPDVWFATELVWEIRGADLTISPVHQAAAGMVHPSRGISLRFPRYITSRTDKTPEDCTTASEIADLFLAQIRKMDVDFRK